MISLEYENQYLGKIVCGSDEVGRGPLAGPVVAAAVIAGTYEDDLNSRREPELIKGVNDSKKLSAKKRQDLFEIITSKYNYGIGQASVAEIEELNILNATKLAITRAVGNLSISADIVLVDGNMKFYDDKYFSIIKGDQKCYSIACASIVAKVYRDNLMKQLGEEFPLYAWHKNAGYGTKEHLNAIKEIGISIHHRQSFIHV